MQLTQNSDRSDSRLRAYLAEHPLMAQNEALIDRAVLCTELILLSFEDVLIDQWRDDCSLYLLFSGTVEVIVGDEVIACRSGGEIVGELELIAPETKRMASVVASESTLVGRIAEPAFEGLAREFPFLWRSLARMAVHELADSRGMYRP